MGSSSPFAFIFVPSYSSLCIVARPTVALRALNLEYVYVAPGQGLSFA